METKYGSFQTSLKCETTSFTQAEKALKGAIEDERYIEKNPNLWQWEVDLIEECLSKVNKSEILFFKGRIEVGQYKVIFNVHVEDISI